MATYLEELHDLFPNGLHALAPRAAEKDVQPLISLFDEFDVQDDKTKDIPTSPAAIDLVDSILYKIDPSLVSKEFVSRLSPSSSTSTASDASNVSEPSKRPIPAPLALSKEGIHEGIPVANANNSISRNPPSSPAVSPTSSRRSPEDLHRLAGKAIARKYEVYVPDKSAGGIGKVSNPVLIPKTTPSSSRALRHSSSNSPASTSPTSPVSPTSPTSTIRTAASADASPSPVRFMSIVGRSSRDQREQAEAHAQATRRLAENNRHHQPARVQTAPPARTSIFNRTSVRPSAPMRRHESSSESEESPPRTRSSTLRGHAYPSNVADRRATNQHRDTRSTAEKLRTHQWENDGSEKKPMPQGRYISSGQIVERGQTIAPGPTFTGYQNGWKPIASSARRPSDGYVLGDPIRRHNNAPQDDEEDDGPTPFHWIGDAEGQPGKMRLIGRGALGSRPGTFKDRSAERFAAATAALEREQELEYANQVPDPIDSMHPAAASWEMQRRGILLRNQRKQRVAA